MSNEKTPVVLVADDEEEMRTLIARFVGSQGYTVHTAANGDEAWEKVQKHHPDLVLLDVRMPGLNGWEVSRNIQHHPELSHIQVIMITGIGELTNELTSPLFGAFAYLDKPFDLSDLEEKMHAALQAGRSARSGSPVLNGVSEPARPAQREGGLQPPRRKPAKAASKPASSKPAPSKPAPASKPAAGKPAAGKPAAGKVPAKPAGKPGNAGKPGKPAGKPAGKAPAKPAGKPSGKKPGKPAGKPVGKPGKPAGKPVGKPGKPSGKPAGKPGKPVGKKPGKPAGKAPAKPAGKPAGKKPGKPAGKKPGKR